MPPVQNGKLGRHPIGLGPRRIPHPFSGIYLKVHPGNMSNILLNNKFKVNNHQYIPRRLKDTLIVPTRFALLDLPRDTIMLTQQQRIPSHNVGIEIGTGPAKGEEGTFLSFAHIATHPEDVGGTGGVPDGAEFLLFGSVDFVEEGGPLFLVDDLSLHEAFETVDVG
eukprot:scaffold24913_cov66-Cyclotella_meneghiniana.AAC.1